MNAHSVDAMNGVTEVVINGTVEGDGAFHYPQHPLNEPKPLRVVAIGAGVTGIAIMKMFRERFAGKPTELVVYEKNDDVGGTWLENRYPGCSCDVPSHGYTYSWEGNPYWSRAYAGSKELFDYFKGRAKAYGVYDQVHLQHAVLGATWEESKGKWQIEIEDRRMGRTFVDEADILVNAAGFLNQWKWPEIPGLHDFQGHLVHSARWDDSYSFRDKTVAVIGSGSSAIQIVPQLQTVAKHLFSVNRSKVWITPEFGAEFAPEGRDTQFSEEQKQIWATNPKEFLKYRKAVESSMNRTFDLSFKNSELQTTAAQQFRQTMEDRLRAKHGLAEKIIPDFAVGCRRITPGHGYLEALCADNVTVVNGEVLGVTEKGIKMFDGTMHEVDAIVCATGFNTSFRPIFPVIGNNEKDLRAVWKDDPEAYLSVAIPDFPNYFVIGGPNFTLANGVFIPSVETTITYIFQLIEKIQRENIKAIWPKQEAVDDFQEFKDTMMKDLVWTSGCRSWYKNGKVDGRVWGPWCGSALHFMEVMEHPRWEDYHIVHLSRNRFSYWGNGKTIRELTGGDLAYYLSERGYKEVY